MTDTDARMIAVFADRPSGQRVRIVSRGRSVLGDKPVMVTIEQELPDNVEARDVALRTLAETVFHVAFGDSAKHLDENGEPAESLLEAHVIDIEGDFDVEATEEAREQVRVILDDHAQQMRQDVLGRLIENSIRADINPN